MVRGVSRAALSWLLGLLGCAGPLAAQSAWLAPGTGSRIAVEVLRPTVSESLATQAFVSGAMFISGRVPLGSGTFLVAELPAAYGSFSVRLLGRSASRSDGMVGNPYVGIEGGRNGAALFGEVGLRVPLATESQPAAHLVGQLADLDRQDVFLPKVGIVSAFVNYRRGTPEGNFVRARAGPLAWIATDRNVLSHDVELWVAYALQAGYESRSVAIVAGLSGRAIVTERVSKRFTDQIVVSAFLKLGVLRPGLSLRLPVDNNYGSIVGSVLGLNLGIEFP